MPTHLLKLILTSGPAGCGKTTTAYEVAHRLRHEPHKSMHVVMEGDFLDSMYPSSSTMRDEQGRESGGLFARNLKVMWEVYWAEVRRRWAEDGEDEWRRRDGKEGRMCVLILSGTGVVLRMREVREVLEGVVRVEKGLGKGTGSEEMEIETIPVVLQANSEIVEQRLRERVLGEELDDHLVSSAMFRKLYADWEAPPDERVVVRRVDCGRSLHDVVEDVLDVCGL
jgi:gluconate kinase